MPFVFKRLALLLSITAAFAADKTAAFKPGPPESFPHHQTNDKITLSVDPYSMGEKVKVAFGKVDPYAYGILPVLVVIRNDTDSTIKLDRLRAEYVGPNGDRIEATPARDVRYAKGPDRPKVISGPGKPQIIKKKNPLDTWEIEGRSLGVQMLTPGQTANGFLYFEAQLQRGATIYITGMTQEPGGKAVMFFELPLSTDSPDPVKK